MSDLQRYFFDQLQEKKEQDPTSDYGLAAGFLYERLTKIQKEYVDDPHARRAILASRRTGKSFAVCTELFIKCLLTPRSNCLYITLTRGSGRGILWNLMQEFDEDFGLGINFNNTVLTATFTNGSVISLVGAADAGQMEKLRGQGFDLVCIDECKSFAPHILRELIGEVIGPTLLDRSGRLTMLGTPGAILSGPFYDATEGEVGITSHLHGVDWERKRKPLHKLHKWKMHENTACPNAWANALELKEAQGWDDQDPRWIREYLGEWVASDDALVYRYSEARNTWSKSTASAQEHGLPEGHNWKYLLGLDLGFEDATAVVVAAYATTHPNLYQVYEYKEGHLTVPNIAKALDKAVEIFGEFQMMVGDYGGLGKTIMETLSAHYGHVVIPAEKREKFDHIELLNSDMMAGKIKILDNSALQVELQTLQWDSSGVKEHDSCENHCCDAFLYLWRYSYHHLREQIVAQVKYGSREYWKVRDDRDFADAVRRSQKKDEDLVDCNHYGFYSEFE